MKFYDSNVYAGMLNWTAQGVQKEDLDIKDKRPGPVNPDILLVKLRPGQVCFDSRLRYLGQLFPLLGYTRVQPCSDVSKRSNAGKTDLLIQVVDMDCFAVKGRGADHAKFSPVATASYRLLPHIILKGPIPREHQKKFQNCFPPGVIEIEKDKKGNPQVVVKNPRKDTVSREVLRHKEFEGLVELTRVRDHFLCEFGPAAVFSLGAFSLTNDEQYFY